MDLPQCESHAVVSKACQVLAFPGHQRWLGWIISVDHVQLDPEGDGPWYPIVSFLRASDGVVLDVHPSDLEIITREHL